MLVKMWDYLNKTTLIRSNPLLNLKLPSKIKIRHCYFKELSPSMNASGVLH
jgi:hypothetical protein